MNETYLNFPFLLTGEGAVATADQSRHIRQRMEQILFTSPGERVMLPEFGAGVRKLLFAGNDEVLAASAEFTIARSLQKHMGNQIMVNEVHVSSNEEKLTIEIVYTRTKDLEKEQSVFELLPFEKI